MGKLITAEELNDLELAASAAPRKRKNKNLHSEPDLVQRFFNGLAQGTYVRPHRHMRPKGRDGFEMMACLRGSVGFLIFDVDGNVQSTVKISAGGDSVYEIPQGVYHSLVCLSETAIILEIKEGPYEPFLDKDFLDFFPQEGSEQAALVEKEWRQKFY